ncbi:MAG TPA: YCF48-related protein, partial [Chloroflexota bacterium]|nr:YCF48-related protein [Chloroflexota bacterium]
ASTVCRTIPFTTSNGGQTWLAEGRILLSPRRLQFVDAQNGWLIGSIGQQCGKDTCPNAVMQTTDGGKSWVRVAMASAALSDLRFVSRMNGWAVGQACVSATDCSGALVSTISGGQIWNNQGLPVTGQRIQLARIGTTDGWVAAIEHGQAVLARTTDGGRTWERLATPCRGTSVTIDFPEKGEGWLVCNGDAATSKPSNGLYHSQDDGAHWQPVGTIQVGADAASQAVITAIDFASPTVGWAVDAGGHLIETDDAGRSWIVRLNAGEPLDAIQFIGNTSGWVLGSRHLWRTVDAGQTWDEASLSAARLDPQKPVSPGMAE